MVSVEGLAVSQWVLPVMPEDVRNVSEPVAPLGFILPGEVQRSVRPVEGFSIRTCV